MELSGGSSADGIVKEIAKAENKFQEELNRAFTNLAEGSFKALRRPLPVTRQKVEWEKIGGYRVRNDLKDLHPQRTNSVTVGSRHWWWTVEVMMGLTTRCCSKHALSKESGPYQTLVGDNMEA